MIYGSAGTLYFDDLPAHIDGNPLQIMAFVFFFTGMAFKLSLVPFHLWTADVYEGAPSAVTAYLSVISKGSAAFVLLAVLIKVFAPMITLFCQFFQIFVYIILNLAIGQLVGFGEDDREGYSIFSQPFHKFQVYFLRLQTAVSVSCISLLQSP